MSSSISSASLRETSSSRKHKVPLAGGFVFGVGIALATRSDNVFADRTFHTRMFEFKRASYTNGEDFRVWDSSAFGVGSRARLLFEQATDTTALSCGEQEFAQLQVRLAQHTTAFGSNELEPIRIHTAATTSPPQNKIARSMRSGAAPLSCANGAVGMETAWTAETIDGSAPSGPQRPIDAAAGTTDHLRLSVLLTANDQFVQGVPDYRVKWHFRGSQDT